jgi:aspartate/methionine/tyrosine aminotransferase
MTTKKTPVELPRLAWQHQQQLTKYKAVSDVIDLASASSLCLPLPNINADVLIQEQLEGMRKYPGRIGIADELTDSLSQMLRRWTGALVPESEILVSNGIYGAYQAILQASDKPLLIVPSLCHEPHKAAFRALGKTLIECPADETAKMDLARLKELLAAHHGRVEYVYICHNRGQVVGEEYLLELSEIICKAKVAGMYDADIIYTSHQKDAQPWLPFVLEKVRSHMLIMGTLSKEFGMPGIRIGYIVGSDRLLAKVRTHQEEVLEMVPSPSQIIAKSYVEAVDLDAVRTNLRERMSTLVNGLSTLGWDVSAPAIGINLHIPVPKSFTKQSDVPADELFSWYVWQKAGVLVRIGSTDGSARADEIRLVISQPQERLKQAIDRLAQAGIHYSMSLPPMITKDYLTFIA